MAAHEIYLEPAAESHKQFISNFQILGHDRSLEG